ncbi:MAG: divalent metal cation transporter, partial [Ferruginibacter sp.]
YTIILILAVLIILIPNAPLIGISLWSQVINALLLPVVLICMILLVNDKKIMGEHVNKPITNIIGWASIILLIGLSFSLLIMPLFNK